MARKEDAPAISLFSFQDIITSLTGIMFLVVIILVLKISVMKPVETKGAETRSSSMTAEQVQELRKKLEELKRNTETLQQKIQELQKLNLDRLWIRLEKSRQEEMLLREKQAQMQKTIRKEESDLLNMEQEIRDLQQRYRKTEEENKHLAESLRTAGERLKKKHAQTLWMKNLLKFNIENNTIYKPMLAECTPTGIRVLDSVSGQEFDLRLSAGTQEEREQKFLDWVQGRKNEYYTIFVKPGSFDYAKLISRLESRSVPRGLEVLPDDKLTIFKGE